MRKWNYLVDRPYGLLDPLHPRRRRPCVHLVPHDVAGKAREAHRIIPYMVTCPYSYVNSLVNLTSVIIFHASAPWLQAKKQDEKQAGRYGDSAEYKVGLSPIGSNDWSTRVNHNTIVYQYRSWSRCHCIVPVHRTHSVMVCRPITRGPGLRSPSIRRGRRGPGRCSQSWSDVAKYTGCSNMLRNMF